MSTTNGAIAPVEHDVCPHLLDGGLDQPLALYLTNRRAEYLCPQCLGDAIERRLDFDSNTPLDAARAVHFSQCDHQHEDDLNRPFCWVCLRSMQAEITSRWARYFYSHKAKANRLHRVVTEWARTYDPEHRNPVRWPSPQRKNQRRMTDAERDEAVATVKARTANPKVKKGMPANPDFNPGDAFYHWKMSLI